MNNQIKVLIVDDEDRIRRLLKMYLERESYLIDEADNGDDALDMALKYDYDVILLDVMMPGKDGIEVCKEIRMAKATPIVMLTAKGEESNRVQGFEVGADDYIVKPFSPREVVLRVKAVLRRASGGEQGKDTLLSIGDTITFPNLTIDNESHLVTINGEKVNLTPKEYDLLYFMARTPERVHSREALLKEIWRYDFVGDLRTIDTNVKRLREKLYDISEEAGKMIVTVWGLGYKLGVPED